MMIITVTGAQRGFATFNVIASFPPLVRSVSLSVILGGCADSRGTIEEGPEEQAGK